LRLGIFGSRETTSYLIEAGLLSLLGKTSSVKRPNFKLLE
jgi:hypothetical protein